MAPATTADVMRLNLQLQKRLEVLEERFGQLEVNFAKYWIDDRKAPAFALVLRRRMDKDGKTPLADLYVISDELSRADLKFGKKMIMSSEESKVQKWEPMVLPAEVMKAAIQEKLAEPAQEEDGNTALIT